MVAVFCMAFLAFCAFGIDMAYVTLNRAKLQRAVETTALASIAEYKNSGKDKSETFFNLFKSKFDIMQNAKLEEVQYKEAPDGAKNVKIRATLISPTFFLRFAGVGKINIKANSYAQAYEITFNDKKSGDIIEIGEIVTDKNGYDIKIDTNLPAGYFIFAGLKDNQDKIKWLDISCKADSLSTSYQAGTGTYGAITSSSAKFDLANICDPQVNANIFTHLKFYKVVVPPPDGISDYTFKITVLNNVKLITKDDF